MLSLRHDDIPDQSSLWQAVQLLVAAALLIAVSPLLAVLALLIKLTSRGPIIYSQQRVGLGGNTFLLFKLRTMRVDAEARSGPQWSVENDPRCTLIGGFLRKYSLDELPQLVNVLRGEMNLVGPRPERPCFVEKFSREYANYAARHDVPVGMTGWAQVHGWRGNTSLAERLRFDLHYVRNRTWLLDLYILLLTPLAVVRPLRSPTFQPFTEESATWVVPLPRAAQLGVEGVPLKDAA